MAAVLQTVGGPFNGEPVPLVAQDSLWFVIRVNSNLRAQYILFHRDANSPEWKEIASGKGSGSQRVDQAIGNLRLDSLGWIVVCAPLNSGTFPVHVQLFQGSETTGFMPISRIAQYDVTQGAGSALQPIKDTVKLV